MKRILVLCTGNACRSQMAEGYLRFFTQERAEITSAGLSPTSVHPLAVEVMKEDNIDISEAQPKSVDDFSGEHYDFLITVCRRAELKKPADITASIYLHYDIPDPEETVEPQDMKEAFVNTRERVKREMLRFIGTHDGFYQEEVPLTRS
ncbi:MAG: arsenate reductase ArsC [Bacteroidota bacterium]